MKMFRLLIGLTAALIVLGSPMLLRATEPKGSLTIDRVSEIKYPSDQEWSPDGKTIAFLWDWAGKQDIYTVQAGSPPVALTDFPVNPDLLRSDITSFQWVSVTRVLFVKEGSLYSVDTTTRTPRRMAGFEGVAVFEMLHDMKQILYVQKGQVWINTLDGKNGRQITRLPDTERAGAVTVSQDDLHISYTVTTPTEETATPLPFNGDRVRVFSGRGGAGAGGGGAVLMSIYGGEEIRLSGGGGGIGGGGGRGAGGIQWVTGPDGPGVFQQESSADRKTRTLKVTYLSGASHTLWKDYDPAWVSPSNVPRSVVSPDGKWVAFISDRTGWPLVYVTPTDATSEKQARPLSSGEKVDGYISWSPDSKRVAYANSNDGDEMSRYISIADAATGKIESVVKDPGVSIYPNFSPDGSMISFLRSSVEHPLEVFEAPAHADAKITRLSSSMPPEINVADLTPPKPVYYPSRGDKKPVPATLWVNKNLDLTKKHPAIIWVHGSGDGQNYLGWQPGSWRMYYAMDQYFSQQGYVILTVDYRGNSGYSRDWATGSYGDPGGTETGDVNAGADYLKTLPYVDGSRIGLWGLSYGGYMVLQSLVVDPLLFNCGIDVAGVGDWYTYSVGTSSRLGGNASGNPDLWDRSAPVRHLDKLARPLLILQGTADVNVPFSETLKVVDTLEKLHKPFDLMIYPGEPHWFRRAFVLQDAWHRAEGFFDMHLMPTDTPPAATAEPMHESE